MIALLLAATALAADPAHTATTDLPLPEPRPRRPPAERFGTAAFRTIMPADGAVTSARLAFVQDFDGASIGELTLRGQVATQSFALGFEVVGTAAASPRWASAGLGNTLLDLRVLFGRGSTHALGLRGTFATGGRVGARGPIAWWGTVPQATVPTWGVALAYEGATPRWAWHAHAGLRADEYWAYAIFLPELLDLGASVATVQPLAERWSLVGEVELLNAQSPLHLRALARRDLGKGWTVDAGLAVPIVAFIRDPTLQVLAKVDRRW